MNFLVNISSHVFKNYFKWLFAKVISLCGTQIEVKLFARCSLFSARSSLLFACCMFLHAQCSLFFARCLLLFARCLLRFDSSSVMKV